MLLEVKTRFIQNMTSSTFFLWTNNSSNDFGKYLSTQGTPILVTAFSWLGERFRLLASAFAKACNFFNPDSCPDGVGLALRVDEGPVPRFIIEEETGILDGDFDLVPDIFPNFSSKLAIRKPLISSQLLITFVVYNFRFFFTYNIYVAKMSRIPESGWTVFKSFLLYKVDKVHMSRYPQRKSAVKFKI